MIQNILSPISECVHAIGCVQPTCVSRQLTADSHITLTGLQVVDGADVVQASTGDVVARRGIGARHHPGGAQWDGMDLEERSKI